MLVIHCAILMVDVKKRIVFRVRSNFSQIVSLSLSLSKYFTTFGTLCTPWIDRGSRRSVPAACSAKWRLSVCIRASLYITHMSVHPRDMHEGIRITRARLAGAKWLRVRRTKPIKIYLRARASANVVSTKFEKNSKESLRRFLPLPLCCSCRLGIRKISARNGRALVSDPRATQRLARRDACLSREREKSAAYSRHNPPSSLVYRVDARFFQFCINKREIKRLDPRSA